MIFFLKDFAIPGWSRSSSLSSKKSAPEGPLTIEVEVSRQNRPDFWTNLLKPQHRRSELPAEPFYCSIVIAQRNRPVLQKI